MFSKNHWCFQNSILPWTTTRAKLISRYWLISSWHKSININHRIINRPMYSKIPQTLTLIGMNKEIPLKALAVTQETKRVHWVEIVILDTGKIFYVPRISKPLETLLTWISKTRRITQTLLLFRTWNSMTLLNQWTISKTTKWKSLKRSLLTQEDSSRVCHLSILLA